MSYESIGTVIIKHVTAKAVLVHMPETQRDVWIPMSLIFEDDLAELDMGVVMELNVEDWFVEKEGLVDEE